MQPAEQRGLYNIYRMARLIGPLDVGALSQSFSLLVRRHESLRTSFKTVDGQPTQLIHPPFAISVPVVDLTSIGREEQASAIQRLASEIAQYPFDLADAPLWRVQLVQLDTHEYLLLFVIHHIVSDGSSMRLLVSDLSVLYNALLRGESTPLPPLEIQYIDYTDWQRTAYQSETLSRQLAYWKAQLAGPWPILDLPRDYSVPTGQTFTTQTLSLTFSDSLREALQALSQQEGATSFMTLLAAFKTLLYRYTGQTDMIVGTPIAGRNRAEVEKLIGCFINTLALRTDLSGNPSFREVLRRVRQVALSAYAHQELPFQKLIEELPSLRNVNGAPLFRAWFNMLPNENPLILAGLRSETLDLVEEPSLFDLSLYVSAMDKLKLTLLYNSDLFSEARMRLLLTHLQSLLESIVAAPDAPIDSYRLPPVSGQNRVQPTNPFIVFPPEAIEQSIPARFVAQVRRAPDQLAIKTKRYAWSYQELNQRADQLAQALLAGEREAGRIALLFEHDAPMIAAMLGVLKAGKTYVALDPFYPQARLLYMLADAEVQAIVTNNQNLAYAQELTGGTLRLINLDQPSALPPCPGWDEGAITLAPDTLAYILYTSGSTGQPKGVMQSHRNVLHFMRTYTNNLHIAPSDKLTLLSSYSFDAAIMDIWGALLNGATLYPFDLKQNSLAELATCLRAEGITIYHSTPTVYRQLMKTLTGAEDFPQLRLIVMGGEAVYKPDVELYKKHFADACLFVNGLGPTESTVTLQYFINKQTDVPRHAVPVGYPVEQTAIVLLDEAGQETDLYGEIAIRSEHVALGYWRKEAQSAAAFRPAAAGSRQRLYRMGDWGRYLPDGSLEFDGRRDSQVKIRGYRNELGEIESALSQHPAVKESAVILLDDTPADHKQLVAYVVLSEAVAAVALRAFMGEKLPSYMVPQAYIQLAALRKPRRGRSIAVRCRHRRCLLKAHKTHSLRRARPPKSSSPPSGARC
ncbi:MAG: amino acid adenylation domain-containing protein [Caldilineaceae bacterium]